MRDPSWMQLSAELRKPQPAPEPAPPPDIDVEAPYLAAWVEYKRRWRAIWLNGVLGWGLIALLVLVLPRYEVGERVISVLFPIWSIVWFFGTMVNALRIIGFSCPRCGGSFFTLGKPIMSQLKCPHCGLRKFQVNDAGKYIYQLKRPD